MELRKDRLNLNMENFSITYIRKCRASKEIQAMWERKDGDYFANENNVVTQNCPEIGIPEGSKWVPGLWQMTDICRNMTHMKATNVNDLNLLSKMRITISSSCCNNYLNSQSMHDFWIMFYMNKEHGKDWNEGANKWT